MPLYEFRCPEGTVLEASYSMTSVPDAVDCPDCGAPAARRITSVRLSRAGSAAYRLIESSQRSAAEPEVVTALPAAGRKPREGPRYTGNPLHRKLPRP
ncbi:MULTISPECIES: FmdB family zinc ribbon protein [Micrococcaceae]|uniref:FmdB family zinc ribbon protein n=1 Tax=Micrococcaceae TaxID=1268 RepID=UPI000255EFDC|nr:MULTISPECIES: zinc ribbon domain-containing protein [unclassified Citricoccus]MBB5750729.1 putative FmdB family regulatory protein [Micrococcus sp. TA1]HRO28940.1 zinc ribbon domain-containing protein [Citricoccus sp.]HRO92880.1 zinc ribbon domain-containing protein [Citricoccus sp.]